MLSSIALEIGTPCLIAKRITASMTINSKFPNSSRDICSIIQMKLKQRKFLAAAANGPVANGPVFRQTG